MGTSIHISTEHTNKKLTNNMSDFAPTETTLPSGVDAQAEDNQISEDKITKQDLDQIDESNIVSGERANKGGVENYAKADDKADAVVEDRAGISVPDAEAQE